MKIVFSKPLRCVTLSLEISATQVLQRQKLGLAFIELMGISFAALNVSSVYTFLNVDPRS